MRDELERRRAAGRRGACRPGARSASSARTFVSSACTRPRCRAPASPTLAPPGRRLRGGPGGRGGTGARGRARSGGRARRSRRGARRRSDRRPPSRSRIAIRPPATIPRTGRRCFRGSCRRRPRRNGCRRRRRRPGRRSCGRAGGGRRGSRGCSRRRRRRSRPAVAATARSCAATLPPRGNAQEPHALVPRGHLGSTMRVGRVGRRVRRDHDPEPVLRVVEREQVFEPSADHRLLVVRRHDHRDARRGVRARDGPRPQARQDGGEQRVAGMRPADRAQGSPEKALRDHGGHASTRAGCVSPLPRWSDRCWGVRVDALDGWFPRRISLDARCLPVGGRRAGAAWRRQCKRGLRGCSERRELPGHTRARQGASRPRRASTLSSTWTGRTALRTSGPPRART